MSTTIESLELEIQSSSQSAEQGLNALYNSLDKLKGITKGGVGLTSIASQMSKLNDGINKLSWHSIINLRDLTNALSGLKNLQGVKLSSTIAKSIGEIGEASSKLDVEGVVLLREIAPALSSLSAVKDVKISSTVAKGISSISEAVNKMNINDLGKISALANAVATLSAIQSIRISSSIATQIVKLGDAAKSLQGVDLAIFGNLAEALVPLTTLGKANLTSSISALKKMPEVVASLNSLDLDTFSSKINQLTAALQPLASQMNAISSGFATFPHRIQQVITSTNSLATANTAAAGSYMNLYARLRMAITAVQTIGRTIAQLINKSNEYVENLNLFNASMGQFASEAQKYAEHVGEVMGIDPGEWMRNQGIFMTLATGFGVVSDRAYIMSQNLTQLGYDLSSFFNISYEDSMQKLQSGISGELEPLRRLGYDLSQARLEAVALSLGIDQTFASMTQAEKAQLRYYAIMTQVTTAQGDMARTLNAPANQLRILQAQVSQAARALGNVFVPILNAVLPVVIALAKAVRILAASIASLFGFSLPEVDYSGIVSDVSAGVGDLGDNLDSAGGSAKKLKSYLMGFDELNIIDPTDASGGGGSGGGGGGGGSDWDWDLPVYDFLGDAVSSRVDELMKKFEPTLNWIKDHLDEILAVAEALGRAFLTWKIAKSFIPDLGLIRTDLKKLLSVAVSVGTIVVMASLVYKFDNKFMETGKYGYLIADGLTTALSTFIVGKVIKNAFGAQAGQYWAVAALTISAGTTIKAIYDHVVEHGFDSNTIVSAIWAAIKGGAAGGSLALALGTSVIGGIAVGAAITLGVGVIVALVASEVRDSAMQKLVMWGKLTLTAAEIKKTAEGLFEFDITPRINLLAGVIENVKVAKEALSTTTELFNANLKKVEIGAQIDPDLKEELTNQLTGEDGLIPKIKSLLSESENQLTLTFSIVPPKNVNGEDMNVADMLGNIMSTDKLLEAGIDDLGRQMSDLLVKGMTDGLTASESVLLNSIQQTLTNVSLALTTGSISGKFNSTLDLKLSDLTRDSFKDVLSEYQTMVTELQASYSDAMTTAQGEMEGRLVAAKELRAFYVKQGNDDMVKSMDETIRQLEADIAALDVAGSVEAAVNADTEKARQSFLTALQEIFSPEAIEAGESSVMQRFFEAWSSDQWMIENSSIEELATAFDDKFWEVFYNTLGDEDKQVLIEAKNVFGFTDWDILGTEVQTQFYNSLSETFGTSKAQAMLEYLGYDLTSVIANGMSNATSIIEDEAGDIVLTLGDGTRIALNKNDATMVAMFKALGIDFVDGMVLGVDTEMNDTIRTIAEIFGLPYKAAADENETHSPSKLFKRLGIYIVEGLIDGLATLGTKLKDTWTNLPGWFQNFINIIVSKFTGMNADVSQLFQDTKDDVQETWSPVSGWFSKIVSSPIGTLFTNLGSGIISAFLGAKKDTETNWSPMSGWFSTNVKSKITALFTNESFQSIGSESATGLKTGLLSVTLPVLQPAVELVKKGWTTISGWIGNIPVLSQAVNLIKSGWSTIASWIGNIPNVIQKIDVSKGNWSGKTWKDYLGFSVSTATQKVDVTKGSWITLPSDKTITYTADLKKGKGLGDSIKKTLKNVFGISLWAGGGFPTAGQLFIAREAGPELVGNIGGRSAVANNDQIVESVSIGVYQAVSAAMGGNDGGEPARINVYLDGEKIYENQQKIARNRGYDLGMGAFSHG